MMNVTTMLKTQVTTTATIWPLSTVPPSMQAELVPDAPLADVPGGPRRKHAGQDRTQRAADAVHAERVERIVVAERRP